MSIRKHESRATWVERVESWRSSGLSGGAFAAEHGLKVSTLYRWGRVVREEGDETPAALSGFVQVPAPTRQGIAVDSRIEVELAAGRRLVLVGPVDGAQLRSVIEALESC